MKNKITFGKETEEAFIISSEEAFARINSYTLSYNTETLMHLIERREIELDPEFQRNFVWDKRRASLFIDSLLIGFPTPSLFFGKNTKREDFIVIDGLQRLKTIYFFIKGEFYDGNGYGKFNLLGLPGRNWNGMAFPELPMALQRRLRNSLINVTVIDEIDFRPEIVHEIFYRINTGGVPLTNQEVRNCVFGGPFNRLLHEMNKIDHWRILLGSNYPDKRLADVELVLRFFALYQRGSCYRPPMRDFLSKYQSEMMGESSAKLADLFERTVSLIRYEIGEDAFKQNKVINRSLAETLMVAIATLREKHRLATSVKSNYKRFLSELNDRSTLVRGGINSEASVRHRIDLALEVFGG